MSPEPDDRTRLMPLRDLSTNPDALDTPADAPLPSTLPLANAATVPGYVITGELGRGGMGVVYEARHLSLGRPVALKMMLGEGAADSPEGLRFLAEAAAVAAVSHPHVVGVYDYGRANGQPYLALELCGKGTLAKRLKSAGRFDPRAAAELLAKIAEGVGAAHAAGIVHRDLKPGNVLFDDRNEPKVSDFGLAKRAGSDLTQTNAVMGTPAYMSPEQAKGETKFVGPPADVWALGVMLYEALTGQRPFNAADPMVMLQQVMYTDPPPVRAVNKSLPSDLDQIVRKCMTKAPHERYPTAGELAADLRNWLDGRPVTARPPAVSVRVAKWVRRNPWPTALMGSLTALAVAIGVGGYVNVEQFRQTTQALDDKLAAEEKKREEEEGRRVAERRQRVTEFQSSMRLALQRGVATKAVDAFQELTDSGLTPTEEMKLDRAKASYFLGETEEAEQRLKAIDREQLPKDRRGEAELLRGLLRLGPDDVGGLETIRNARSLKLSAADDAFAAGMLAESTTEALTHFRVAFDIDPAHIDSRVMAAVALTLLARYDEAFTLIEQTRPLAPDHPFLQVLYLTVAGMKGEIGGMDDVLAEAWMVDRGVFCDQKQKAALLAVAKVFGILPELRKNFGPVLAGDDGAATKLSALFGPKSDTAAKVQAVIDSGLFPKSMGIGLPPCFRADMMRLVSECLYSKGGRLLANVFKRWLSGLDTSKSVFVFTDRKGQEEAKKVLARFPEGTLKGLYGAQLFENALTASEKVGKPVPELWDEAAAALEDAARTPGHVAPAWFFLENAAWAYHLATIPNPKDPANAERHKIVARLVEERLRMDPQPTQEVFRRLCMAAAGTNDQTAYLPAFWKWEKAVRQPSAEFDEYVSQRFMAELGNRQYGATLNFLRSIDPTGSNDALRGMNNTVRQRLRMPELLPPPRKAD